MEFCTVQLSVQRSVLARFTNTLLDNMACKKKIVKQIIDVSEFLSLEA